MQQKKQNEPRKKTSRPPSTQPQKKPTPVPANRKQQLRTTPARLASESQKARPSNRPPPQSTRLTSSQPARTSKRLTPPHLPAPKDTRPSKQTATASTSTSAKVLFSQVNKGKKKLTPPPESPEGSNSEEDYRNAFLEDDLDEFNQGKCK
jgi:hypothetical protein